MDSSDSEIESEIEDIKKSIVEGYENSLQKLNLKILIFGPGQGNIDEYAKACFKKRLEIKKILIEKNHTPILPEEAFEEAERQGKEYPNITAFERYLIENCDISIFLHVPNCPGVDHELSAFSSVPECARKIHYFYANDQDIKLYWPQDDNIDFIRGSGGRSDSFCREDIGKCNISKKILETVDSMRRVLVSYPYKKYKEVK